MLASTENACASIRVTISVREDGAQGQNRTADTRIFSPLLYRLSYLGVGVHYIVQCLAMTPASATMLVVSTSLEQAVPEACSSRRVESQYVYILPRSESRVLNSL